MSLRSSPVIDTRRRLGAAFALVITFGTHTLDTFVFCFRRLCAFPADSLALPIACELLLHLLTSSTALLLPIVAVDTSARVVATDGASLCVAATRRLLRNPRNDVGDPSLARVVELAFFLRVDADAMHDADEETVGVMIALNGRCCSGGLARSCICE